MIISLNHANALGSRTERTLSGGEQGWTTSYFGDSPVRASDGGQEQDGGAQAFLVEQSPGSAVLAHFHTQDQFQVVVAGDGTMNRHAIASPAVHYANRHTGYGPIIAGPGGLSYFTLRAVGESGANYIPGAMDKLDRKALRRQMTAGVTSIALPIDQAPTVEKLMGPTEDGVAAWCVSLLADQRLPPLEAPTGAGRFIVVLEGQILLREVLLDPLGVSFVPHTDIGVAMQTRAAGARILVLQLPARNG